MSTPEEEDFIQRVLTAADRGDTQKISQLILANSEFQAIIGSNNKSNTDYNPTESNNNDNDRISSSSSSPLEEAYFNFYSKFKEDMCGQTIFHIACACGRPEVLKLLLVPSSDNDEDATISSNNNLSIAIPGHFTSARIKLLTASDSDGWNPLKSAIAANQFECVKVLLSSSDDQVRALLETGKSGLGGSVLDMANECENKEIAEYLRNAAARVGLRNSGQQHSVSSSFPSTTTVPDLSVVVGTQRAKIVEQQMQLQQLHMMFHQTRMENDSLNVLLQKEKADHEQTKARLAELESGK